MSNIINSQNPYINNTTAYGRKNNTALYTQAPASLPKFSIDNFLNEKDEFRKNVLKNQKQYLSKPESNFKLFASVLAITGLIILALTHKK